MKMIVALDSRYNMEVVEFYFVKIFCEDAFLEMEEVKTHFDLSHEYQYKSFQINGRESTNWLSIFNWYE